MGWARGYHGYVFEDHHDGAILGAKKFGNYVDVRMWAQQNYNAFADDRQFPLASILREVGDTCKYTYDMGDKWSHILRVEEVADPVSSAHFAALGASVSLIDGHGGCPPEDSMGMGGCYGSYEYPKFLSRYRKASASEQKKIEEEITQRSMNYEQSGVPIPFHPIKFILGYHRELLKVHVEGTNVVRNDAYIGQPMFGAPRDDLPVFIPCLRNDDKCAACLNKLKVLMHCAKCKKELYCSRECQVRDWKRHKKTCQVAEAKGAAKKA